MNAHKVGDTVVYYHNGRSKAPQFFHPGTHVTVSKVLSADFFLVQGQDKEVSVHREMLHKVEPLTIQICDWMRGRALEGTGFSSDETRTGTIGDAFSWAHDLFEKGLNVKIQRNGPNSVRIWVDTLGFGMR